MTSTTKKAAKEPFLEVLRQLTRTYQAFERYDAEGIRRHDLTPAQADVIFSLGNTEGMSCSELGEKTLITKGTLTGILDRLQAKGLIARSPSPEDRRSIIVRLTHEGEKRFEQVFPAHIDYLKRRFSRLSAGDRRAAVAALRKVRAVFD